MNNGGHAPMPPGYATAYRTCESTLQRPGSPEGVLHRHAGSVAVLALR